MQSTVPSEDPRGAAPPPPNPIERAGRFGELLQEYRRRAGLTQIQLADLSTVSVRAIRDLELGRARRPRRDTVRLLADGLRLTGERRALLDVVAGRDATDAVLSASYGSRLAPPPTPAGPCFGRHEETRLLYDLIAAGEDRLIAVTGMGGVGKTRLALAVAHALHERNRMPVLWVPPQGPADQRGDHGPAAQPAQVLAPWLRDILARADGAVDDLADFIAERPFLLVLDGQDATPSHAPVPADALIRLLSQCPGLRIVSTARKAVAPVIGQRLFPVLPLAVGPEPDDEPGYAVAETCNASYPAAELVHWHLRRLRPHWRRTPAEDAAIRALCWRLDGIPLALESAAAWSLIASPIQLARSAARDPFAVAAPPSDRGSVGGLRAALTDTIADLTPPQRRLLAVMSEYGFPWSLDDVADRTYDSLGDVSYAAHDLLVRNLIRPVEVEGGAFGTFTVLNTVRQLILTQAPAATFEITGPTTQMDTPLRSSGQHRSLLHG